MLELYPGWTPDDVDNCRKGLLDRLPVVRAIRAEVAERKRVLAQLAQQAQGRGR